MCVLVRAGAHNGVATLRLVNGACVAETLLDQPPTAPIDTEVPFIDKERLKKRAERALRQAELEYDRVSEGVSKEAQAIFEAISKTLPCRWQDMTTIVVLVSSLQCAQQKSCRARLSLCHHTQRACVLLPKLAEACPSAPSSRPLSAFGPFPA